MKINKSHKCWVADIEYQSYFDQKYGQMRVQFHQDGKEWYEVVAANQSHLQDL